MRAVLAWIGDWLPPSLYFLLAGNSAASLNGDLDMTETNGPLARLRKERRIKAAKLQKFVIHRLELGQSVGKTYSRQHGRITGPVGQCLGAEKQQILQQA